MLSLILILIAAKCIEGVSNTTTGNITTGNTTTGNTTTDNTTTGNVIPCHVTTGFLSGGPPVNTSSAAGVSFCNEGLIGVTVTSERTKLLFAEPFDQASLTESVVEILQVGMPLATEIDGGQANVTACFNIWGKLCGPGGVSDPAIQTVQVLSHGDTSSLEYWDISVLHSYLDRSTEAGYATFSYDRIGVQNSEHPDPIQVVQAPLSVEILHTLVDALRKGQLGGKAFRNVVGVGHGTGSTVTQAVTTKYPGDFDAVILTGISNMTDYVGTSLAALNPEIANLDESIIFNGLPNGYLLPSSTIGIQTSYYRYPNFDPELLTLEVTRKQTLALGELLTLGKIVGPSPRYTGPVDVVLGENDFVFCGGDCSYPIDQSAAALRAFYPAAGNGSQSYLVPGSGHAINAHHSASDAFTQMLAFLQANHIV